MDHIAQNFLISLTNVLINGMKFTNLVTKVTNY
jgi:hypothetical protein